jgi:hypothetical protein
MDPGSSIVLTTDSVNLGSSLPWVCREDQKGVDYCFRPEIPPPSQSEVAQKFPALSPSQYERVIRYCSSELCRIFQNLEVAPYFSNPKIWALSIYDHAGTQTQFLYKVNSNNLELISENHGPVGWLTEVSFFKLHAAIEFGETLSSMYLRVNDTIFDASVEADLAEMEVLDDPLIRCLFNGKFGAYQREQLKRLRGAN